MRKVIFFFVVWLLSAAVVHAQAASANTTELRTALQFRLDEWHKAGSFPGATLGVVLANGESFSLAVGFSDRDSKTAMKPTNRMLAGSVGKTFAAATVLQLIKEGKIKLVQVNTSVGRSLGKPLSRVLVEAVEVITKP